MHVDDIMTVVRIVDLGSFSRAAEFLGMSQSNVSHRVQQVERELGTPLFIREGRRVRPSDAGLALVKLARELEENLTRFRREFAAGTPEPALSIATPPPGPLFVVPRIVSQFLERMPSAHLRFATMPPAQIRARLLAGELDFGLLGDDYLGDGIAGELQSSADSILIAPRGHAILEVVRPTVRAICAHRFVVDTSMGSRGPAQLWAAAHGAILPDDVEVDSVLAVLSAVIAGVGLGFVSEIAAQTLLEAGEVVRVDAPGTPLRSSIYLAYAEKLPRDAMRSAFIECFIEGRWRTPTGIDESATDIPHVVPLFPRAGAIRENVAGTRRP